MQFTLPRFLRGGLYGVLVDSGGAGGVVADFYRVVALGLSALGAACAALLLVLVAFVLFSGAAHAEPVNWHTSGSFGCNPPGGAYDTNTSTLAASCATVASAANTYKATTTNCNTNDYIVFSSTESSGNGTCVIKETRTNTTFSVNSTPSCPGGTLSWNGTANVCTGGCAAHSTWNGTSCACDSGYSSFQGACVADCPVAGGGIYIGKTIYGTGTQSSPLCIDGCQYDTRGVGVALPVGSTAAPQGFYSTGVGGALGPTAHCAVSAGTVADAVVNNPPTQCPVGQCPGTINGQPTCLPCAAVPQATITASTAATTETKNASGTVTGSTTTTTSSSTTGGAGGAGVTTTTTTEVTKDASGAVTGTVTKTTEQRSDEFCKLNPSHASCKVSAFGGSCGAFTCEGDAVQCALAKEVYKRNCTLFEGTTDEGTLYGQIKAGSDPLASTFPNDPSKLATHSFSGAISQTPFLASGTLTDLSFEIQGHTITVPMSRWNDILAICGMLLVAFSLVAAARIVAEGA